MRRFLVTALLVPSPVFAATLAVPSQHTTIQAAINAAASGDTIEVAAGTYGQNLDLNGKRLTLIGLAGSAGTRIRPLDGTAISIRGASAVTMRGFRVDNRDVGQGFHIEGSVVDLDDVLVDNQQNDGTTRSGNPDGGGAYIVSGSTVTIANSSFQNNQCDGLGGGIYVSGSSLSVTNTTFDTNDAPNGDGGGLAAEVGGAVSLAGVVFISNTANGNGGGLFADATNLLIDLTDVRFEINDAQNAGGAYLRNAAVSSVGSVFLQNTSGASPAALSLQSGAQWTGDHDDFDLHTRGAVLAAGSSTLTMNAPTFTSNSATRGGAIAITSTGSQTITNGIFTSNTATSGTGRAGAIDFVPASPTASLSVTGSAFTTNVAGTASGNLGGALYVGDGRVALVDDVFTDNRAGMGGAIYTTGTDALTLTRVILCANDALAGQGGGLFVTSATGTFDVRNVVFNDNTATSQGGGLYVNGTSSTIAASVVNNTFAGNAGSQGGSAYFQTSGFDFRNNVVWRSSAGNGVSANAGAVTKGYSLVYGDWFLNTAANLGDALGPVTLDFTNLQVEPQLTSFTSGDQTCVSDKLWPRFGSPVVNAGDPAMLDRDGSRSDIGAFGGAAADPSLYLDADTDGSIAMFDCNDANAAIRPGAVESCNLVDDDCDGLIDEAGSIGEVTVYPDVDADTYGKAGGATLACPGVNGFVADNKDCNDANAAIHPAAVEVCDLVDNDCDGLTDEPDAADALTWYADADQDGHGNPASPTKACARPPGAVTAGDDCNDANALVNPSASEVCDGIDNDCDGTIDVGVASGTTYYVDADTDGFGDAGKAVLACSLQPGYATTSTDCDDTNGAVNPAMTERCNGIDDNCDLVIDGSTAVDATIWYVDTDHDLWGDASTSLVACSQPSGYADKSGDCNNTDARFHPYATEVCTDPADYNCDGSVGSADVDADGTVACLDCNDADPAVHPGAVEICNALDDDCDALVDESAIGTVQWFLDTDGDGYGNASSYVRACFAPASYVADGTDCNDQNALYHPGADEACTDTVDFNCDGAYGSVDNDQDGVLACDECDDFDPGVHPGASDVCDGIDNDCDALTDEEGATWGEPWYADADGDGYGDAASSTVDCDAPDGFVGDDADCDDQEATSYPGADDAPYDGIDADCDGADDYDQDGDRFPGNADGTGEDCDDAALTVHPGATETPGDGIDQDCDGTDLEEEVTGTKHDGCNCDASSGGDAGLPALLLGLLAVLRVRRRGVTP